MGQPKNNRDMIISWKDVLIGFISCSILSGIIHVASFFVIIGPWVYPKWIGLYIVVPYYTITLFMKRDEKKDGAHWHWFSQNNIFLNLLRNYLQLHILQPIPKELIDIDQNYKQWKQSSNSSNNNKKNDDDDGIKKDDKPRQVILGVFPHGSYCDYRVAVDGLWHEVLPNMCNEIRTLAASALFRIPIAREIALWTGCIDASKSVAEKALRKGRSLLIIPGGEAEQIRCTKGKEILYLSKRKGFVKLAMKYNVPVCPVYVFGCSDYYTTSHVAFGIRNWLVSNCGICIPLTFGQWGHIFVPKPIPTTLVVGKPIQFTMQTMGQPTDEEVVQAHAQFTKALQTLFDTHKASLGYGDRNLEIL